MTAQRYGEVLKMLRIQEGMSVASMADSLYLPVDEYLNVEQGNACLSTLQLTIAGNILGCDIVPMEMGEAVPISEEDSGRLIRKEEKLKAVLKELDELKAGIEAEIQSLKTEEKAGKDIQEEDLEQDVPADDFYDHELQDEMFADSDEEILQQEDQRFREYVDEQIRLEKQDVALDPE